MHPLQGCKNLCRHKDCDADVPVHEIRLVFWPAGVATGAIVGHAIATAIAVIGGSIASQYISEKTVGYIGGVLFLVFALATGLGYF